MTAVSTPSAEASAGGRYRDEYDDVVAMLAVLRGLPPESHEYRRQRERIVTRCLPLADHVASHFARRGEGIEDLRQVARLGLLGAIKRFDPDKGMTFTGFAVPTMMGEVRRYFRDHTWSMRVPRRLRELHVQINRATTDLIQRLGRAPSAGELAEVLGVPHEEIVECLIVGENYRLDSLDAPRGNDDSGAPRSVADGIGDLDPGIEHITERETLRALLAKLPDRERDVLGMRFFESMTQSQIAERIGVSQMQVSRILAGTLRSLRDELE
jgi:RNA polymerase sigma-B factor